MRSVSTRREYVPKPWEGPVELGLVSIFLVIVLLVAPLGTQVFIRMVYAACGCSIAYAAYRLIRTPGISRRWGFQLDHDPTSSIQPINTGGCILVGSLFLASVLPMMLLKMFVEVPNLPPATSYLVWCAVQDFVFFALVQRNLEDRMPAPIAIGITAMLFGLSHYPFTNFMMITALVGLLWGCLYWQTRSLTFLIGTHWIMGLITLS
jgi:membrane protease YdiL (CAAX protease family)